MMQPKSWWKSKTIWAHALALAAYVAQKYGVSPVELTPTELLLFDAIAGIVLRFFTKQPVTSPVPARALRE